MKSLCLLVLVSSCVTGALAKTQCEEHRERELAKEVHLKFVPECTEEGEYKPLQCFSASAVVQYCMCWTPDGRQINGPSPFIKACDCHVHIDRQLAEGKLQSGDFVPTCNGDGTYSRKQCDKTTRLCWCSDENGNKVSEESKGGLTC